MRGSLKINSNCVGCGSCLGLGYNFLETSSNGDLNVKSGTILDDVSEEFRNLSEICPVKAFELDEADNEEKVLSDLIKQLKEYKGLENPNEKQLKMNIRFRYRQRQENTDMIIQVTERLRVQHCVSSREQCTRR